MAESTEGQQEPFYLNEIEGDLAAGKLDFDQIGKGIEAERAAEAEKLAHAEMRQMDLDFAEINPRFEEIQPWVNPQQLSEVLKEVEKTDTRDVDGVAKYLSLMADLKAFNSEWFESQRTSLAFRQQEILDAAYILRENPAKFLDYLYNQIDFLAACCGVSPGSMQ